MDKIKNILDRYLLNGVIYKLLIIVITMAISVPLVHMAVGSYVKLLLIYGFLIVSYGILNKSYLCFMKDKLNWILLAFACSYLITVVLNRDMNFSENIKALAYMLVFFVMLYMNSQRKQLKDLLKEIEIVSACVILCTFILSAVSFAMYVLLIEGHYMTENGFMYYGMYDNRLWGVYNANTGSTLNGISILLSVGFISTHRKKKRIIILNAINILLQFCCLILTGSRASLYALMLMLVILAFAYSIRFFMKRHGTLKLRSAAACLLIVLLTAGVYKGMADITKYGLSYIPGIAASIKNSISDEPGDTDDPIDDRYDLNRLEEVENREGGFFNGRVDIWKACLRAFEKDPVFGTARENVYDKANVYLSGDTWREHFKVGGPHNIYVCIMISSGIVGFLLIVEFAVFALLRAGKAIVKNINTVSFWMLTVFLITVFFCITEFVEARILYQVNVFYALFWIYCGYMTALPRKMAEQDQAGELIE